MVAITSMRAVSSGSRPEVLGERLRSRLEVSLRRESDDRDVRDGMLHNPSHAGDA
jgi:hypothetical protein